MVSMILHLGPDVERKLLERAHLLGLGVDVYVEFLIRRAVEAPVSILEAAEPIARAVDASGVTDEEFMSLIQSALDASRHDRRMTPPSAS